MPDVTVEEPEVVSLVKEDRFAALGHRVDGLVDRFGWLLAGLVALAVFLFRIERPNLWRDEISTWWASTISVGELWHLLHRVDVVNAPYYVVMRLWIPVAGETPAAMRLPSALAAAGAVMLLVLLGRKLFSPWIGLTAGLLLVAVPHMTRYAQEARGYTMAIFAVVLSALLLVRAFERPTWWRWVAYAASVALVGWLHLLGISVLAAHAAAVLVWWHADRDRRVLRWVVAAAAGFVPVLPLVIFGFSQKGQIDPPYPSWDVIIATLWLVSGSMAVGYVLVGLAAAARWTDRRPMVLAAGWALFGPALLFLASYGVRLFVWRYVLFVLPAICLLAAVAVVGRKAGLATWQGRAVVLRAALVVLVVLALGVPEQRRMRAGREDSDYAAAYDTIAAQRELGDMIAYVEDDWWYMLPPATEYYLGPGGPRDVFTKVPARDAGWWVPTECEQPRECLTPETRRIWLIRVSNPDGDLAGIEEPKGALLREDFTVTQAWTFTRIRLVLLTRKTGPRLVG